MGASHHLITASRVDGQPVFSTAGEKLGKIADLMIDKATGATVYALMAHDGFLGIGEQYYPIPWSKLDYDPAKQGFRVSLTRKQIEGGHHVADKEVEDEIEWREDVHAYYGVEPYWSV
ncbi:PRC-barrel domain-containing protein [uncultured Phenylobacterium sp.]|uniref:PRC-barrel domain-containing protein n=1 Tax=uncultured Phenylobacterium sp. TaxID=349273 RepID=UPI0025EB6415|nr:PRC-barrel domain-containing protein [uncultured Phenylobacterium sp.]